jgi:heme-degrading monooxygenase HmoA
VEEKSYDRPMTNRGILEHAVLPIKPGEEVAFEAAFAIAKDIISGMPGFVSLTLSRGIERPGAYLLLVWWDSLADHETGFRGSPEYQRWRALLHNFYEPFPLVEHYAEVAQVIKT